MTTTINASTSSGLVVTPDNSGNVVLQYNGQSTPAFSALYNTTQSIPNTTWTKLTSNVTKFDTNSNYANSRFTPTVSGYYQINASAYGYPSASGVIYIALYKTGVSYNAIATPNSNQGPSCQVSVVMYLAAGTDYVEAYFYQNSGGALLAALTDFSGCLLRGA